MDDIDRESLERRVDAVERALSEGGSIDRQDRLDEFERRLAELEAAVQAIRGYVGTVRAVNDEVEQRADLALRKVAVLERHLFDGNVERTSVGKPDETDARSNGETSTNSPGRLDRLRDVL